MSGVIVAALVAAAGAYLVAARQFSGKIETSDAKDLWEESRSIREWSREQIAALTARVAELEAERDELRRRITELESQGGTDA